MSKEHPPAHAEEHAAESMMTDDQKKSSKKRAESYHTAKIISETGKVLDKMGDQSMRDATILGEPTVNIIEAGGKTTQEVLEGGLGWMSGSILRWIGLGDKKK